jgi:beta-glucanase (GH16 family)
MINAVGFSGSPPPEPAAKTVKTRLLIRQGWLFLFLVFVTAGAPSSAQNGAPNPTDASPWVLTWSDEFNGPDGSAPDPSNWLVESGGNGWGNNELEYYTRRAKNVREEGGYLVIEALKERFVGSDGVQRNYTSARLKTEARFSQRYGRFEARIQIPSGQGAWPAFWMMGDDYSTVGWPACGEIDVMESAGTEASIIQGSLHGPGYSGVNPVTAGYRLPRGRFSDSFHIFAVEWAPQVVRFYVDDKLYATRTPSDLPAGKAWVYDHPFFVLLDLAVGGNLPGQPGDATVFPQRMLVDYVRVYRRK